ncbi:swi5-dependent recombination DNA repair protein 1 homolog [Lineus longissimus]|uniref:swi5-dependent recombination DNA repair protein 1 homolog n=1 Tax=Lineus longissimus TaxID=88925 RepID=UPI00315D8A8C
MARPMSRALKERLKRIGRVYSSPVIASNSKRQCHVEEEKGNAHDSESSQQIGDCQLSEEFECASLQTRGQSLNVDVAEALDLGCWDSQADSYCEERLDSQPRSQDTSELELGNLSGRVSKTSPIVRTIKYVQKDAQANTYNSSAKRSVSPNNSSAKRPCVSPNISSVNTRGFPNISKPASSPTDMIDSDMAGKVVDPGSLPCPVDNVDQLKKQRTALLTRLNRKEELLRKLNMVKMYRAKNDLTELQVLIDKWRTVSQDALQELVDITNDPKPSLKELIDHLHLDYKFIGFNQEEETFLPT